MLEGEADLNDGQCEKRTLECNGSVASKQKPCLFYICIVAGHVYTLFFKCLFFQFWDEKNWKSLKWKKCV